MAYDRIRQSALSHRAVVAFAIAAVVAVTAIAATPPPTGDPYRVTMSAKPVGRHVQLDFRVVDAASGEIVLTPRVIARPGEELNGRITQARRGDTIEAVYVLEVDRGVVTMDIVRNGKTVQKSAHTFSTKGAGYSGDPISLDLVGADLQDVLRTFGTLTGMTIVADPNIQGTVTVHFVDMPWDQALDIILKQNGLTATIEKGTIRVSKASPVSK